MIRADTDHAMALTHPQVVMDAIEKAAAMDYANAACLPLPQARRFVGTVRIAARDGTARGRHSFVRTAA